MVRALFEIVCDKEDWAEVTRVLSQLMASKQSTSVVIVEKKEVK